MPVLVTSEGKAVCGSLEIAKFVNDKPGTVNLTPKEHALRNDKLVKAACSVDAHKLLQGHYINTNSSAPPPRPLLRAAPRGTQPCGAPQSRSCGCTTTWSTSSRS